MLSILFIATFASFLVGVLLIRYQHVHSHFSADHDIDGVQKFHTKPVPRIGGIAIATGLVLGTIILYFKYKNTTPLYILAASIPAFMAGIVEDITKRVRAWHRLLATFFSAVVAAALFHAYLNRIDIEIIDIALVSYPVLAIALTAFCVGGIAHSMNIIDGYNGLSSMISLVIITALAYVCFKVGDPLLLGFCFSTIGALLGFFFLNYPKGYIFAGDGGAYLMGFLIAEISILLVINHPEVSAWFPLLLVGYPVSETLFSIYRKKIKRGISPGVPDGLHLHMLVYKRFIRWMTNDKKCKIQQNSMTSPYLWCLSLFSIAPAIYFWNNGFALMVCTLFFAIFYILIYRMIVIFKTPSWLRLHHRRQGNVNYRSSTTTKKKNI